MEKNITLYHFTSLLHFGKILADGGLSKGDVPINTTHGYNAVWFTTTNMLGRQSPMLNGSGVDKTEVRITVEFTLPTPKLYYWKDVASKIGVERQFYRSLDEVGGYSAKKWWLYAGVIPTERFNKVEFRESPEDDYTLLNLKSDLVEANKQASLVTDFVLSGVTVLPFPEV